MKQIEKWYITNIRDNNNAQRWLDIFHNAGENKPFVILTGVSNQESMSLDNHLRYLWRFNYEEAINTILERINKAKLWEKPSISLSDFEDLYDYVYDKVNNPKVKYIGQLAIYDICIHLIWLWGEINLLPKDYVYIHALPRRVYHRLVKEGIIKKLIVKNGKIKTAEFRLYFPLLRSDEIEDLLCWLGKSIRILEKNNMKINIANIVNIVVKGKL
jgi:hypothetical protein